MLLEDLPCLSDADREALADHAAIEGVPVGDPPADSPDFEQWRNQRLVEIADDIAANHSSIPEGARAKADPPTRVAEIAGSRRTGHAVVRVTRFETAGTSHTRRYRISLRRWARLRDRLIGGIGPYRSSGAWLRNSLDVSLWETCR